MRQNISTVAFIQTSEKKIPVNLFDHITIEALKERKIQIIKKGKFKFPTNHESLVYQVAKKLHQKKSGKFGVKITIEKNIPTNCGLLSQSGNAIGVLSILRKLWGMDISQKEIQKIGQSINPRIPFLIEGLKRCPENPTSAILIRPKHIRINEKWLERETDGYKKNPEQILKVHFPDLAVIINHLKAEGASEAGISGTGSMIYGLFDSGIDTKELRSKTCAEHSRSMKNKIDFIWSGETCKKTPDWLY